MTLTNIGYAHVLTEHQNLHTQLQVLKKAGCKRTLQEKVSGAKRERPELTKMLEHLREGDAVIVLKLDHLARSTRNLLEISDTIAQIKDRLKSLTEHWEDTTSPAGRMVLNIIAGLAKFKREPIHVGTGASRIPATKHELRYGRPSSLCAEQAAIAMRLLEERNSAKEVAKTLGVLKAIIYWATASDGKKSVQPEEFQCA